MYATLYLQAPFVPVKTVLLAARRQVQLACFFINNTYSSPAYLASTARRAYLYPLVFIFFLYIRFVKHSSPGCAPVIRIFITYSIFEAFVFSTHSYFRSIRIFEAQFAWL